MCTEINERNEGNDSMFEKEALNDLIRQRREVQQMYARAVERYWEIKTRVVDGCKEGVKQKILKRYTLEKKGLNEEINDLGDRIWRMRKKIEMEERGEEQ